MFTEFATVSYWIRATELNLLLFHARLAVDMPNIDE
jgi:hypothetical protein